MHKYTTSTYYVEIYYDTIKLGTATGFFIKYSEKIFFVTNRHVVTGRHIDTKKCLDKNSSLPNCIKIFAPVTNVLITTIIFNEDNVDDYWIFCVDEQVDVAILKNLEIDAVNIETVDIFSGNNFEVSVTEKVTVVGYPYGEKVSNKYPTYITGHVATEIDVDYGDKQLFLVDARTREGQSGSPVYFLVNNGIGFDKVSKSQTFRFASDTSPAISKFLGIYSGRINEESDLGKVWKKELIIKMLSNYVEKFSK